MQKHENTTERYIKRILIKVTHMFQTVTSALEQQVPNNSGKFSKFKNQELKFLLLFRQEKSWFAMDNAFINTWLLQNKTPKNRPFTLYQFNYQIFSMFEHGVDYLLASAENEDTSENPQLLVTGSCLRDICVIHNKMIRSLFGKLIHKVFQKNILSDKLDNLTFLMEDIVGERVSTISNALFGSECDEVINIVKMPEKIDTLPSHLKNVKYLIIRCLRKNYNKHLKKIRSYDPFSIFEEVFHSPIVNNNRVDLMKYLKHIGGFETQGHNGILTNDHLHLVETVEAVLRGNRRSN
jgi:hypothetical protein